MHQCPRLGQFLQYSYKLQDLEPCHCGMDHLYSGPLPVTAAITKSQHVDDLGMTYG